MTLGPHRLTDEYGRWRISCGDVLNKSTPDRVAGLCIREFDLRWKNVTGTEKKRGSDRRSRWLDSTARRDPFVPFSTVVLRNKDGVTAKSNHCWDEAPFVSLAWSRRSVSRTIHHWRQNQ
jgi:hypothetical protein